ncbi:MAG: prepilin peptidase [Chloroflexi bacterium]|nr:prepilin peptidase [Chloroflexota bacterium]MBU1746450.1 prepilin peptidase [Chloroflexota bacterium]
MLVQLAPPAGVCYAVTMKRYAGLGAVALAVVGITLALYEHYSAWDLVWPLGYAWALLICATVDLAEHRIPNVVVVPAIVLALLAAPWWGPGPGPALLGGALVGGFFLVGYWLRWNGMGDVKLGLLVGLILGFPGLVYPLAFGFLVGGVAAGARLLVGRREYMAYGPYIRHYRK